jgi:anti-sigma factor RsiW
MSDFRPHPERGDELLSAYLDDDLSPEERVAVEARLAEDAQAREMLHQLRAVSQAVQGLPQEIVGHDLGESVLQRV